MASEKGQPAMSDIAEDLRERRRSIWERWSEYKVGQHCQGVGGKDRGDWLTDELAKAEARVAELEVENKRLRECADVMADRLEDAYSQMAGGCDCYNWTEMKRAAGAYRAAFPREETKNGG